MPRISTIKRRLLHLTSHVPCRLLEPLRHAGERRTCLPIAVDRKCPAHCQMARCLEDSDRNSLKVKYFERGRSDVANSLTV